MLFVILHHVINVFGQINIGLIFDFEQIQEFIFFLCLLTGEKRERFLPLKLPIGVLRLGADDNRYSTRLDTICIMYFPRLHFYKAPT